MRNVIMYSGGIGSFATARRVIERGSGSVELLFCDTRIEDDDCYRFVRESAAFLGVPLHEIADGRTPWEVFRDVKWIGNARIAQCSHLLKQAPARAWVEANCDPADTVIHLGLSWDEEHRVAGARKGWAPWALGAVMCEAPYLSKREMLADLATCGIAPPRLYAMGFPHNNCGGFCVRAGQSQFALLLRTMPDRYAEHERAEDALRAELGKDVSILRDRTGGESKPLPLRVLRERVERSASLDLFDWGGCGCFVAPGEPPRDGGWPDGGGED